MGCKNCEKINRTPMEHVPSFVKREGTFADESYDKWLSVIKSRLQQSQIKAAIKVNHALMQFYWDLGRDIVRLKAEQKWGDSVIEHLSLDLKSAFPNQKGFSTRNIRYAKQWFLFYSEGLIKLHQAGAKMPKSFALVPWRHHVEIITKCRNVEEALFYINKVIENNWSRRELEDFLESDLYRTLGKAPTNVKHTLPSPLAGLAQEILKDPYNFDFLSMTKGYDEKRLEDALFHNITRFLLELGNGFAFVGRQMELRMPGGKSFFPDMIFYHIRLKCYVVIELKVVDFTPEFAGKLNFYVTAVDKLLRGADDNPTIGLLICKSKDKTLVEWSFQDINKPLGVASYQLQEIISKEISDMLPSAHDIEKMLDKDQTNQLL